MLCYFDDYSRNILNKRMSLATKETSLVDKMENNILIIWEGFFSLCSFASSSSFVPFLFSLSLTFFFLINFDS